MSEKELQSLLVDSLSQTGPSLHCSMYDCYILVFRDKTLIAKAGLRLTMSQKITSSVCSSHIYL